MAKTNSDSDPGVNKSAAVRELLAQDPNMSVKDIVTTLGSRGLEVNTNLVYLIRSKNKKLRRKEKREQAAAANSKSGLADPIDLLRRVKALAAEAGGYDTIKQLVEVLTS